MPNPFEKPSKLYSNKSISIATLFGGPLAAGILMQRNFNNLGNELYGKHALSLGILFTVLIFGSLFVLPEAIVDKIPNSAIPAIYTPLIYWLVEKFQGKELKKHKSEEGEFYSGWKAAGIGFVCSLVIVALFLGLFLLESPDFDAEKFDIGMAEFAKNEEQALSVYGMLEEASDQEIQEEIRSYGLPNWIRNLEILNELSAIENLPEDLKLQIQTLNDYCQLRLKAYRLIDKSITEQTDRYSSEVKYLHGEIEDILVQLEN